MTTLSNAAATLRAAADLAEQRAQAAQNAAAHGLEPGEHRWEPQGNGIWEVGGKYPIAKGDSIGDAEHIAGADPAFMLTIATWWRWAASLDRLYNGDITRAALESAQTYLRAGAVA